MVEPIVLEFKIDDIYIDNPLLSKNDLLKYDTEYCYEKVTKEIDRFIKAQLNFPNIKKPTITCNYEVRYECFVPRKVDKVGDYVTKKITQEEQIKISLSHDTKDSVVRRSTELGLSGTSEYFRLLADLDISVQRYQSLVTYINLLYNRICETQQKLGIYATPLQEVPIINLQNMS